jgi:hypothetical protein
MKSIIEIIESINKILLAKEPIKIELIKVFQKNIWGDEQVPPIAVPVAGEAGAGILDWLLGLLVL